jgi:hypothetical protein
MIDEAQERQQAQALFEPYNRDGAAVTLRADGEQYRLGPGVEFTVLRAIEDAAGGVDFWLLWKALGYQDQMSGQQCCHCVRIVSVAEGKDELHVTDQDGQELVLAPYPNQARWREWQAYRRANAPMFAEIDANLLAEARRTAG